MVHPEKIRGEPFLFWPIQQVKGAGMMGKRKEVADVASEFVTLRLTPAEKERLAAVSARVGMNASETLRALLAAAEAAPVVSWVPSLGGGGQ